MEQLPTDLQNIILDYKSQLDITEKFNKVLKQLKELYKYEILTVDTDEPCELNIQSHITFGSNKYFYSSKKCIHENTEEFLFLNYIIYEEGNYGEDGYNCITETFILRYDSDDEPSIDSDEDYLD